MFLFVLLAALGGTFQLSKAQISTCNICQTQVNTIGQFDFGTSGGFKSIGFLANISGSPFCQDFDLVWTVSAPGAQITQDGPWARVDFPQIGPIGGISGGIIQVCCTYKQWRDTNSNGIAESWEICEDTLCINVSL